MLPATRVFEIKGRALITGGTSGIGFKFAQQLAQRGLDLVLVARDENRLSQTAAKIKAKYQVDVEVLPADLLQNTGLTRVKERLLASQKPITVFINNAGAGCYDRLTSKDYAGIRKSAELMALAPMELGGAAAVAMKERGYGLIISTISVAALVPMGAYSAIKAMLKFWSDSLYTELLGTGVHVVSFLPSWVRTEFHARTGVSNSSLPDWIWMNPQEVVAEAIAAAQAGKPTAIPGRKIRVLAFFAKHLPACVLRKVGQKLNKGRR
ncbi:SDR family NAD(P)-dependent oxidoreductase [Arcanobacterium hippocoleae]|uniref:SDR family NAD(P)-dependent oxidoreductase n=1 Tax=Arcanobacterium hippocoleae TaxID=149017 RepID=UPI0033423C03